MHARRANKANLFDAPTFVTELNSTETEQLPTLSKDGLEVIFESSRSGGPGLEDIWGSVRASVDDPFGAPALVTPLNSVDSDRSPRLSNNGKMLLFVSTRPPSEQFDVWVSTRADLSTSFAPPQRVEFLSSPAVEYDPFITRDGREIFFSSDRDGDFAIWRAQKECL